MILQYLKNAVYYRQKNRKDTIHHADIRHTDQPGKPADPGTYPGKEFLREET